MLKTDRDSSLVERILELKKEKLLIIKTKASLLPEIVDLVKGARSYEVPEVIALLIVGGNPDYLEWIDREVRG
jgi:periplasmic divalent cation tolerance protein